MFHLQFLYFVFVCVCVILFARKKSKMNYISSNDILQLAEILPTDKIAIVSTLQPPEQEHVLVELVKYNNYTDILISEAFHDCVHLPEFGKWLGQLPHLKYLGFIDMPGFRLDYLQVFFNGLANSTSLKTLDISGLHFGPEGAFYVSEMLKKNNSITSLDIKHNNIQALGLKNVFQTPFLTALNFSCNNIHPGRWSNLIKNTSQHFKKIVSHNNCFDTKGLIKFVAYLNVSSLTQLDLSHTHFGHMQIKIFFACIAFHPTLLSLKCNDCDITSADMSSVAWMLRSNTSLLRLFLQVNPIGQDGHLKLVYGLQQNYTLQYLLVDGCSNTLPSMIIDDLLSLRQTPIQNETITAYLTRMVVFNQNLNLANIFWNPKNYLYYPQQSRKLIMQILLCFRSFNLKQNMNFPVDIQLYILKFWFGVQPNTLIDTLNNRLKN